MDCLFYCVPKCNGKACGDDGCEGSCGECADGEVCVKGECAANQCGDFVYEGCCDGYWLKWCENGAVEKIDCRLKGPCGWSVGEGYYNCGTEGEAEPSGKFPLECPGTCKPACDGKVCGDDGCGSVCGMCHPDEQCLEGMCVGPAGDTVSPDTGASDADAMTVPDDSPAPDVADVSVADGTGKKNDNGCSTGGRPMPGGLALILFGLALLWGARHRPSPERERRAAMHRHGHYPHPERERRAAMHRHGPGALCATFLVLVFSLFVGCGGKESKPQPDVVADVTHDESGAPDVVSPDLEILPGDATPDVPPVPEDALPETVDAVPDEAAPVDVVEMVDTLDINCHNLPSGPFQLVQVPGAIATEDLAFDGKGNLVGSDFEAIYKSSADGKVKLFVPGFPFRAGMRMIPSGELVVCDNEKDELVRVDQDGVRNTILQGLKYPNGLTVDLKGYVYLTEHDAHRVLRIHPYSGEYTVLVDGDITNPNGIVFNPTYDLLYIGTFGGAWIWTLSISPDGVPGRLEKWGDMTHTAGLLDGLGVDACGYVYVCEYGSTDIWRLPPDGKNAVRILDSDPAITYLPNMQWGRGEGWDPNSLYLPDGWKVGVWRLEIGVPSAPLAFP